jgi:hypothetical protein
MIIIIFIIILIILFLIYKNEEFNESINKCEKIPEGKCNSKLCPKNCQIKKNTTNDNCHCIKKIENIIN